MSRGKAASPGDTNVAKNGYHYTRTEERWVLTHHLLAEQNLGRPLRPDEQAYFLDGDRRNLVAENVGTRPKRTNGSRRKGQLYARIEQLMAEFIELDPEYVDELSELVERFRAEGS